MLEFETVLYLAEEIARSKKAEVTAITWFPSGPHWMVAFGGVREGVSHVLITEPDMPQHLIDYELNWHEFVAEED